MSTRFFLTLFIAAAVTQLATSLLGLQVADNVSKCFLLPALCGYYLSSGQRSLPFILALAFCCIGDILLIFHGQGEMFFMGGLTAFLSGHILYILAYRQHRTGDPATGLLATQKVRFSLPVALAGTGLYVVVLPALGSLKTPVLVYAVVIVVMVMTALFRHGRTSASSFWLVFSGAVLFMVSDSILALNKFLGSIPNADFYIMLTYIGAQFLIVEGVRRHH